MKNKFLASIHIISLLAILLTGCSDKDAPETIAPAITLKGDIINVTRTSATIMVHIEPGTYVEEFGFAYSTVGTMPEGETQRIILPYTSTQQDYTVELSELMPNTTYYFYFYASNGYHQIIDAIGNFNTREYDVPQLGEIEVSNITETSLSLRCQVIDNGGGELTGYGFRYKYGGEDGENEQRPSSIDEDGYFSVELSGLKPASEYQIQAFAYNNKERFEGTSYPIFVTTLTPETPLLSLSVSHFDEKSISLSATLLNEKDISGSITEVGFCLYGRIQGEWGAERRYAATLEGRTFSLTIAEGLEQNSEYQIYAYAINQGVSTGTSETVSVTTLRSEAPTVEISSYNNITDHSVEVEGKITDNGGNDITNIGFSYKSATGNETIISVPLTELSSDNTFKAVITGLTASTSYQMRAFAGNQNETGYSEYVSFTTTAPVTPRITANIDKSGITGSSIQVEAVINSVGGTNSTIKEVGFCWSTSNKTPTVADNKATTTVNGNSFAYTISNLPSETTYYIRAYATNESGIGYSDVLTATTLESNIPDIEDNPSPEIK